MGLFVGAARLNACHSLAGWLSSAESATGVKEHSCQMSQQVRMESFTQSTLYLQLMFVVHISSQLVQSRLGRNQTSD